MFRYAGSTYHSAAQLRRRLERDRDAFEAQASVYRRLMDTVDDLVADAAAADRLVEADVLRHEVERFGDMEREMQASVDAVEIELSALARRVGA